MKGRHYQTILLPAGILILLLALSGCQTAAEPAFPAAVDQAAADEDPSLEDEGDYFADEGTDLEGVNVCQRIPAAEVSAVVGPLREDDTTEDPSIAGEVGCTYYDQEGHFYDLAYYPLWDWDTVEYALNDAVQLDGLLDGAWMGTYSGGEITVKALVEGEMVIGVHVSSGDVDIARSLIELAYQNRP